MKECSLCRRLESRVGRAFTLIELLVVVSIIAVLASMLLPALSKARQRSQTTVCMNNLKQLSLLMSTYLEENDTINPRPGWGSNSRWIDIPAWELGKVAYGTDFYNQQASPLWDSPSYFGIMRCPSDVTQYSLTGVSGSPFFHPNYGMNGSNSGAFGGAYERRLSAIKYPSEVMYLGDAQPNRVYTNVYLTRYGTATLSDLTKVASICRHNGNSAGIFAFADLHAEMRSHAGVVREFHLDTGWSSKFFDGLRKF